MRRRLHALALLVAVVLLGACAGGGGAPSGPFPGLAQFAGREIRRVQFEGDLEISEDTLRRVVTTRGRSCKLFILPICPFGYGRTEPTLDLGVLSRDVVRIQLAYRDNGYYGTRVVPDVQEIAGGSVDVTFRITPGDLVTLRVLEVQGVERADSAGEIARKLPLKVGEPFRRNDFLASVDTVRNSLLDRGFPYAQVLRNYSIDTIADVAEVQLVANTGAAGDGGHHPLRGAGPHQRAHGAAPDRHPRGAAAARHRPCRAASATCSSWSWWTSRRWRWRRTRCSSRRTARSWRWTASAPP
jgi:hypothetical protein